MVLLSCGVLVLVFVGCYFARRTLLKNFYRFVDIYFLSIVAFKFILDFQLSRTVVINYSIILIIVFSYNFSVDFLKIISINLVNVLSLMLSLLLLPSKEDVPNLINTYSLIAIIILIVSIGFVYLHMYYH